MAKAEKKEDKAEKKPKEEKDSKEEKPSHKAEKESHKAEKEGKEEKHKKAGKEKEHEKTEKHEKKEEKHEKEKPAHKEEKPVEEKAEDKKHVEEKPAREEEDKRPVERGDEKRHKPKKQKPKKGKGLDENFVELKPAEVVEAIVHLANEGRSASDIGTILRDQYGIPKASKVLGKKISAILEENQLSPKIPEDLMSLISKSVVLRDHLEKNRKDMSAKRGLMLTVSKIRALERYYKKKGRLPLQWRYTPEIAALLAK